MIKKTYLLFLCLFTLSAQDVESILKESDRLVSPPQLKVSLVMRLISQNGDIREVRAEGFQKQMDEVQNSRLFLFNFPSTVRGSGLLIHSYGTTQFPRMWMYLSSIKRVKRIALETSGGGYFMGSDFTFNDLVATSSDRYTYEYVKEEDIEGYMCYVIKEAPKEEKLKKDLGYLYTLAYYRKEDSLIFARDYFDLSGELLKIYRVKRVKILDQYKYPSKIVMENIQNGHKTEIEFNAISVEDIPDTMFTHRYLQNR